MTTTPQAAVAPAKVIRIVHAAMFSGIVLFALVGPLALGPAMAGSAPLSQSVVRALLAVTLGCCGVALLLHRRFPRRSREESANLFWTRAATPAMVIWAPIEFGALFSIFVHARTDALPALVVTGIAALLFIVLNPAYLEKAR